MLHEIQWAAVDLILSTKHGASTGFELRLSLLRCHATLKCFGQEFRMPFVPGRCPCVSRWWPPPWSRSRSSGPAGGSIERRRGRGCSSGTSLPHLQSNTKLLRGLAKKPTILNDCHENIKTEWPLLCSDDHFKLGLPTRWGAGEFVCLWRSNSYCKDSGLLSFGHGCSLWKKNLHLTIV